MDKAEYQIKLDEINRLIDLQEYEDALEIVKNIEWKRVKSVKTLCMVAEIYEINGELEESMKILQIAYKRSSLGKLVLYRQVELALKMKKNEDAMYYYNRYLEAAPNDTTKYILKYKIYKAQKSPVEELITILEEYKEREYTERWVYELAKLYKQAGNQEKCVETCNDLILWFGEGKYVIKAMELKMTYVPLSSSQKAKYEQYCKEEQNVNVVAEVRKPPVEAIKNIKVPETPAKIVLKVSDEAEKTTTQKPLVPPSFESISAAAKNKVQKAPNYIKKEAAFVMPIDESSEVLAQAAVTLETENKEEVLEEVQNENIDTENIDTKDINIEVISVDDEIADNNEGTSEASEELSVEAILAAAAVEIMAEKEAEEQILQEEVSNDIPEEAPVQSVPINNEELQKNLAKSLEQVFSGLNRTRVVDSHELPKENFEEENMEDYLMKDLEPENVEDNLIPIEIEESNEIVEIKVVEDVVPENESIEIEIVPEVETVEEEVQELETVEDESKLDVMELDLDALFSETSSDFAKMLESFANQTVEESKEEEFLNVEKLLEEALPEEVQVEETQIEETQIEENQIEEVIVEDNGFDIDFEAQLIAEAEAFLNRKEEDAKEDMDLVAHLIQEAEPSESLVDETPEDKHRHILDENYQTALSEEQKALFSYFCKVPGMNEQILDAINGVYRYADERTSRRGNVAIMGSHGMGKTRLGEGLVKAICKQFGMQAAKYARIDAVELNKKDIATVVAKMSGGFLMVERAHLMNPETIGNLAKAMEFRTDSMILIIEDEKNEMRQLLAEYPKFAEKFETIISIPVFTNDELVTFARTYAKENGFKMDELGVLALYALIGDNQRDDEPVTIGRVKSMVDMAIRHATNARLGRRLSKRHVDETGRILLYEKDFED